MTDVPEIAPTDDKILLGAASQEPRRKSSRADDAYHDAPFPMVDPASRCIGSYRDVVVGLRKEMQRVRESVAGVAEAKLEIAVFGHGGRDTNCWLAIVEAMAQDGDLRNAVHVSVYSCSWPDDAWEEIMASFVIDLESRGEVVAGSISFNVMKYHEECGVLAERVARHLEGKHLIIQCEQGVDMFVEPVTGEWLQDNYEDFAMHSICIAHAENTGVPVMLVQTNSDLDLTRGIDGQELATSIFGGRLQTEAFNVKLKPICEADAGRFDSLIKLAITLGVEKDKKVAFQRDLNYDTAKYADMPSIYASFIVFAADRTNAMLPVAGITEVLLALINSAHELPWCLETQVTAPQWLLARCLLSREADGNRIRVVSQFRAAGMDTAQTFAEFLARWMLARSGRRMRHKFVAESSRFKPSFWMQLLLAQGIAEKVRSQFPDFKLWCDGGCDLLQRALVRVGEQEKVSDLASENKGSRNTNWAATTRIARSSQPDFGELSPLWKWTWPDRKSILDFSCRLLESPRIDEEFVRIASGLPTKPHNLKISSSHAREAELLGDALVAEAQLTSSL